MKTITYTAPLDPCATCGSTVRYTKSRKCVKCVNNAAQAKGTERKREHWAQRPVVVALPPMPKETQSAREAKAMEGVRYEDVEPARAWA